MKRLTIEVHRNTLGDPELVLRDEDFSQVNLTAYSFGLHGYVVVAGLPTPGYNFATVALETSQCERLLADILGPLDFSRSAMKVAA